MFILINTIP